MVAQHIVLNKIGYQHFSFCGKGSAARAAMRCCDSMPLAPISFEVELPAPGSYDPYSSAFTGAPPEDLGADAGA